MSVRSGSDPAITQEGRADEFGMPTLQGSPTLMALRDGVPGEQAGGDELVEIAGIDPASLHLH